MRIYSKFKDYYDNVVPPSNTVVWYRKDCSFMLDATKQLPINKAETEFLLNAFEAAPLPPVVVSLRYVTPTHRDILLLGLCGKLYLVYLLYTFNNTKTELKAFLNIVEFVEFYNNNVSNSVHFEKNKLWHKRHPFNEGGINAWYQGCNQTQKVQDIFIKVKTPIFLMKRPEVRLNSGTVEFYVNPNLSEYGIQRLFDPWTMYQEIEMYLSNTLAVGVEKIPIFSDELKRDAHGFDNWSFKQIGPKPRKTR